MLQEDSNHLHRKNRHLKNHCLKSRVGRLNPMNQGFLPTEVNVNVILYKDQKASNLNLIRATASGGKIMKLQLIAVISLVSLAFGCTAADQQNSAPQKIVDLTYSFDEQAIYWPTAETFKLATVFKGQTAGGYHYEANNFSAAEHGGTHLDAPVHFFDERHTVDAVPLQQLIGEAALIDVAKQSSADSDYLVSADDIIGWEKAHGRRVDGMIVLLRTGFGKYWPDRKKYMGTDQLGDAAVKNLHFPGLHPDAAVWLVENRKIKAIGLDTPSIDYGQSKNYQSHVTLFQHNIPAFENVANLDLLPDAGFQVIALPMKIRGGSGAPLRIIAILE